MSFNIYQKIPNSFYVNSIEASCRQIKKTFFPFRIKGTDASWLDDEEAPSDLNEFSDDEQERVVKRSAKASSKRKLEDNSLERHRRYEKTMNQCNTLNTRVCKLMDAHKNLSKQIRYLLLEIHTDFK